MNEDNLSKRLTLVASQIPRGSRLADIGSDHAYLPCYALKHGIIQSAIAGEVNEGPFLSALEQVNSLNYDDKISVRKGNGLAVMEDGEVDVITIAGMGGPLISTILEEGKEKLHGVTRLVLQPNVAANQVRIWLEENGWKLIAEDIVEEDNIIYEILTAEQVGESPYTQENYALEILLGPFLMKNQKLEFKKKWQSELIVWKKILNQFDKAIPSIEIEEKRKELQLKIKKVEEVIR